MTRILRLRACAAAAATAALLGVGASAVTTPADAAPVSQVPAYLTVSLPAVGGVEVGPGGVPGGSFQQVTVIGRPAIRTLQYPPPPAGVTFSVANLAPWHAQQSYRYLSISWRNLRTGRTGHVNLRHWRTAPGSRGFPASLPTSATVTTFGGPVVATVSVLREQYRRPPLTISVIPGVVALDVPD